MNFTDQMGRQITLSPWPPRRIISLVPSQTEYLADLGLNAEVVGITKFCIHPADWFQKKKRVGGTKTLDFQKIDALQPDLLIGNKEENDQSQIEFLAQKYPVWMSDIHHLDDALQMMRSLGELTGKSEQALSLIRSIEQQFAEYAPLPNLHLPITPPQSLLPNHQSPLPNHQSPLPNPHPKVAYLIWRKPYMAAGGDTFIDAMLRQAGFENVFSSQSRYPEISAATLAACGADLIFLSSEPYPFSEKHIAALQEICPGARIQLVDGELFSWYGSRLLRAPAYFAGLRNKLTQTKSGGST